MLSFGALTDLINNTKALSRDGALFFVFSQPDTQDEIIRLNTDEQLFERGIDSEGQSLGTYAASTIIRKSAEGIAHPSPYAWVTLFNDGDFYESFQIFVDKDSFTIVADSEKPSQDLAETYGEDIVGLTELSKEDLNSYLIDYIIEYLTKKLLNEKLL